MNVGRLLKGNCNVPGKTGNPEWILELRIEYDKLYELASKLYIGTKKGETFRLNLGLK